MNEKNIKKLIPIFKIYPEIKLVYYFGSRSSKEGGPLSDYDFAIYIEDRNKGKIFDIKLILMSKIARALKTDAVDVVALNSVESPELRYEIISKGRLIYEKAPFRVTVEPRILNEYFDFREGLLRNKLTRA